MANINTAGLRDWLIQRISALVIGLYTVFNLVYILTNRPLYFSQWHRLYDHLGMKLLAFVTLFAILAHTWIGLWTVLTDYVKNIPLRFVLETLIVLLLIAYIAWGIEILWG